jgi:hydroxymethylpyrimidine pyrophosphatase-like HAD family hydrolase
VDAVVGENGAFTFFVEKGVRKRIDTLSTSADSKNSEDAQDADAALELRRRRLRRLGDKIKTRFPDARWASDQAYREYDLAIDICEDVKPWNEKEVQELLELCHDEGAHAKLSSIHVNTWFGDYDKGTGFEYWLSEGAPGLKGKAPKLGQWLFVGDSPNDEPMYKKFEYSVGVANLKKFVDQLTYPPTWITSEESGKGFAQVARKLLLLHTRRR